MDLRDSLFSLIGVKCVFPASALMQRDVSIARVILESQSSSSCLAYEDSAEDMLVKLKILDEHEQNRTEVIREIIRKLYFDFDLIHNVVDVDEQTGRRFMYLEPRKQSNARHPGLAGVLSLVESRNSVAIVHHYHKHSLLSISRFHTNTTLSSPTLANSVGLASKDLRIRFIIFQLLQTIAFIHHQNLCLDEVCPDSIMLDDDMWIYLPVGLTDRACSVAACAINTTTKKHNTIVRVNTPPTAQILIPTIDRPIDFYQPLPMQWISGKLSNFEYLMAVNYAAGRTMLDPLYHPIIPWVTDFTVCHYNALSNTTNLAMLDTELTLHDRSSTMGYRDLGMTKFRLSKGDAQLDTTYRHSDPPHHVPESLSELTYYIYLSRRTPMQVLRRVVRDVFVPEHYPHSVARIYDWTPDECIPEFYNDVSVFQSIHRAAGLNDLELPAYASTPEEFIKYHRAVLESEPVSRNLHRWIDLTFGYCLDGDAAIDNMNVPLKHTLSAAERMVGDSPSLRKNPGFMMLFSKPHPQREFSTPFQQMDRRFRNNKMNKLSAEKLLSRKQKFLSDSCDLDALIDLDHSTRLLTLYNRLTTTSKDTSQIAQQTQGIVRDLTIKAKVEQIRQRQLADDSNGKVSSNNNTMRLRSQSINNNMRRSLMRPPVEPSYTVLRYAGDIGLTNDSSGRLALQELDNHTANNKFAYEFAPLLEFVYKLPDTTENNTAAGAHIPEHSDSINNRSSNWRTRGDFWDHEFLQRLQSNATLQRGDLHTDSLAKAQSDDMFAVGCIIAELYAGKPMVDPALLQLILKTGVDAGEVANNSVSATASALLEEVLSEIYRRASDEALIIRRLVSLLLQQSPAHRPKAAEMLQACLAYDQSTWTQLDFSLQRSSGYETGYVDFNTELTQEPQQSSSRHRRKQRDTKLTPQQKLQQSMDVGDDPLHAISKVHKRLIRVIDSQEDMRSDPQNPLSCNFRTETLNDFCNGLFPYYFKTVYQLIGDLKLCAHGIDKICILLNNLDVISTLPLEGLGLALNHFLDVIGDPTPFITSTVDASGSVSYDISGQSSSESNSDKLGGGSNCNNERESRFEDSTSFEERLLMEFPLVIDVIGSRIGMESTEKLVVPKLVDFFGRLNSTKLLGCMLKSTIWNVIVLRAGVKCFLKYFLPLLLTYQSAGSLHYVGNRIGVTEEEESLTPLWASLNGASIETSEWLHKCPLHEIKIVQQRAVLATTNLVEPESLGPGLTTRYILPALMCLVGMPNLAAAGFDAINTTELLFIEMKSLLHRHNHAMSRSDEMKLGAMPSVIDNEYVTVMNGSESINSEMQIGTVISAIDQNAEAVGVAAAAVVATPISSSAVELTATEKDRLEAYVYSKASYNPAEMFNVQAILNLSFQLSELVISNLILSKVFNVTLAELEVMYRADPKPSTVAAFMEVILLLKGLLPSVAPEIVHKDYLQASKWSGISLPRLLLSLPLKPYWTIDDHAYDDLENLINCKKLYSLHVELCKLIVSSSMIAGAEACTQSVLPFVDKFFRHFVETFSSINVSIESKTMRKAFELGAELFLPLAQLTGAEAFYTAVPNLNPRLELWLVAVGSNIPAKSLPSNILPEVVSETTSTTHEKKKGFMNWISSRSSKWTSSSSSTANSTTTSALLAVPSIQSAAGVVSKHNSQTVYFEAPTTASLSSRPVSTGRDFSTPMSDDSNCTNEEANKTFSHYKSPTEGMELRSIDNTSNRLFGEQTSELGDRDEVAHRNAMINADSDTDTIEGDTFLGNKKQLAALQSIAFDENAIKNGFSDVQTDKSNTDCSTVDDDGNDTDELRTMNELHAIALSTTTLHSEERNDATKPINVDQQSEGDEDVEKEGLDTAAELLVEKSEETTSGGDLLYSQSAETPKPEVRSHLTRSYSETFEQERHKQMPKPFERYRNLLSTRTNNRAVGASSTHYRGSASPGLSTPSTSRRSSATNVSTSKKTANSTSKMTLLMNTIQSSEPAENSEAFELREMYYNDLVWMLSGSGRWDVEREVRDKTVKEQMRLIKGFRGPGGHGMHDWNPPAQISLTAPRIALDVATDATATFALDMNSSTQFRVESEVPGHVRCMAVNANESVLMTCSKSGVRLWSLNSHPIQCVSSYKNHTLPPFTAGFMRNGLHAATCDGNIHVWDIETKKSLGFIAAMQDRGNFASMNIVPPRYGIIPALGAFGDDQILTTAGSMLSFYDFRSSCTKSLSRINDWHIPQLPVPQAHFVSSTMEPLQLTSAASHDYYVYTGSSTGGVWVLDRRMGKVLRSWQAHDGPIVKIQPLSDRHFITVSDRSASVWEYIPDGQLNNITDMSDIITREGVGKEIPFGIAGNPSTPNAMNTPSLAYSSSSSSLWNFGLGSNGDIRKALSIKNMPDNSNFLSSSTVLVSPFEQNYGYGGLSSIMSNIRGGSPDKGINAPTKPKFVLYCISGHKMYAGRLPTFNDAYASTNIRDTVALSPREGDYDELKLTQTYFNDRRNSKLTRTKLQITSAVLLPLRRLLLVGTDEGIVRLVS